MADDFLDNLEVTDDALVELPRRPPTGRYLTWTGKFAVAAEPFGSKRKRRSDNCLTFRQLDDGPFFSVPITVWAMGGVAGSASPPVLRLSDAPSVRPI